MKIALAIALIVRFLTLLTGNLLIQSQPPSYQLQAGYEYQTERPIQLVNLAPEENARSVSQFVNISASFDFLSGSYPILPQSLKLIIDGVDVTEQSRIAATEDIPSSQGEILFEPSQPLYSGWHTAAVHFANEKNEQFSYTWRFHVASE